MSTGRLETIFSSVEDRFGNSCKMGATDRPLRREVVFDEKSHGYFVSRQMSTLHTPHILLDTGYIVDLATPRTPGCVPGEIYAGVAIPPPVQWRVFSSSIIGSSRDSSTIELSHVCQSSYGNCVNLVASRICQQVIVGPVAGRSWHAACVYRWHW